MQSDPTHSSHFAIGHIAGMSKCFFHSNATRRISERLKCAMASPPFQIYMVTAEILCSTNPRGYATTGNVSGHRFGAKDSGRIRKRGERGLNLN